MVPQRGTETLLFTSSPGLLLIPVSSLASVRQPVGTCSQTPADLAPQAPLPPGVSPKEKTVILCPFCMFSSNISVSSAL